MILPKMPNFNLEGKRALVTGASSGIGIGCACALASSGAEVTLAARSLPKLNELHDEMNSKGWSSRILQLDIAEPKQIFEKISGDKAFDILKLQKKEEKQKIKDQQRKDSNKLLLQSLKSISVN